MTCGCKPGTYETGWHEQRCQPCLDVEMAEWTRIMEWVRSGRPMLADED